MSRHVRFVLIALGLVALQAQTPAQAPIRHLEYRVSVHSTHTAQGASYYGTATGMQTRGMDGTMSVDILALAKDGGMVVRAIVTKNGKVRPDEPVTCAVYGDGSVVCPAEAPNSGAVNILFSTLGRGFYDPTEADSDGKWTRSKVGEGLAVHNQFARKPTDNGDVIVIHEHTEVVPRKQIADGFTSETDIRYNVALSVPLAIHDFTTYVGHGSSAGTETTELTLTKDSFAH